MKKTLILVAGFVLVMSGTAFAENKILKAKATLYNVAGKKVGTAKFLEVKDGVEIVLKVSKLSSGKHGWHLHDAGICKGPDFKSAGAHFNPMRKQHGLHNHKGAHAGDLPNLVVDAKGNGRTKIVVSSVSLKPDAKNSLFHDGGTSIVIHEKADDEKTDPSGNSGNRVACGVIVR